MLFRAANKWPPSRKNPGVFFGRHSNANALFRALITIKRRARSMIHTGVCIKGFAVTRGWYRRARKQACRKSACRAESAHFERRVSRWIWKWGSALALARPLATYPAVSLQGIGAPPRGRLTPPTAVVAARPLQSRA